MLEETLKNYANSLAGEVSRGMQVLSVNAETNQFSIENTRGWKIDVKLKEVRSDTYEVLIETITRYSQPINIVTLRRHNFKDDADGRTFPVDAKDRSPERDEFFRYHNKRYDHEYTTPEAFCRGYLPVHLQHVMDVGDNKLLRKGGYSEEAQLAQKERELKMKRLADEWKIRIMSEEDYVTAKLNKLAPEHSNVWAECEGATMFESVSCLSTKAEIVTNVVLKLCDKFVLEAKILYTIVDGEDPVIKETSFRLTNRVYLNPEQGVEIEIQSDRSWDDTDDVLVKKLLVYINKIKKYAST